MITKNECFPHWAALFCWVQLTINSGCRSEVTTRIRTEPPTLCGEHFLGLSACFSQWEVSHQGSEVRKGVWIKLISFSRTDSKNCRLSLWKYPVFTRQVRIMSVMQPLTDRWQNRFAGRPWIPVTNCPARPCGKRTVEINQHMWASAAVSCSMKYLTHSSSTYLWPVPGPWTHRLYSYSGT